MLSFPMNWGVENCSLVVLIAGHVDHIGAAVFATPKLGHDRFTSRPRGLKLLAARRAPAAQMPRGDQGHQVHQPDALLVQSQRDLGYMLIVNTRDEHSVDLEGQPGLERGANTPPLVRD